MHITVRGTRLAARTLRAAVLVTMLGACARASVAPAPDAAPAGATRIVGADGRPVSFDALVDSLARADVVFFGEQHDDAEAHRLEVMLLRALAARSPRGMVLSLEMFERDAQPALDSYLAGRMPEADFLAGARPWPRYATDYRPMVEAARAAGWPVVAANVPRPIASAVARRGLAALDSLPAAERAHAAAEISCPDDGYRTRFMHQMRSHSPAGAQARPADTLPTAAAERFYLSQCVKDETMAESIVRARRAAGDVIVYHVNGAFHSDYALGTAARVQRREPGWRIVGISVVPVDDPASAPTADHAGRADYLIFSSRPR